MGHESFEAKLGDGTPVNAWYAGPDASFPGTLQTDYTDGELNGDPIFDSKGRELPSYRPVKKPAKKKTK